MKIGKKSKNIQDARSRGIASNDYPTYLSAARDRKNTEKYWGSKPASKSQMAKDAGINSIDKIGPTKKKLPTKSGNPYGGKSRKP